MSELFSKELLDSQWEESSNDLQDFIFNTLDRSLGMQETVAKTIDDKWAVVDKATHLTSKEKKALKRLIKSANLFWHYYSPVGIFYGRSKEQGYKYWADAAYWRQAIYHWRVFHSGFEHEENEITLDY